MCRTRRRADRGGRPQRQVMRRGLAHRLPRSPAIAAQQVAAIGGEAAEQVLAEQQVGVEFRLQPGGVAPAGGIQPVLVGIEHRPGPGAAATADRDLVQRLFGQPAVRFDERDEGAARHAERRIGRGRPALAVERPSQRRRGSRAACLRQQPDDRRRRGGVERDAELPVRPELRPHRGQRGAQRRQRRRRPGRHRQRRSAAAPAGRRHAPGSRPRSAAPAGRAGPARRHSRGGPPGRSGRSAARRAGAGPGAARRRRSGSSPPGSSAQAARQPRCKVRCS